VTVWLIIWIIGAMFTDGLKDPYDEQGYIIAFNRLFRWPWELGQYLRFKMDEGNDDQRL